MYTGIPFAFALGVCVSATPTTSTNGKSHHLTVVNPHITSPSQEDVSFVNSTHVVTWDTSTIPPENKDDTGLLLLGYLENGSENLDMNPLASDFLLVNGQVPVFVPIVPARPNYIVVLFGDSGNASPMFAIKH
ncbi:hypothetical protein BD410DRAFT_644055 [Rickenella mellea]|uniref:Galactose oxidase-like Early set domain-containing protein n=1 Tax=Rickenella mellea TaxID=50990 RepID=A0A4Y7PMF8_9AGAM|nr:hypothetical protein BD410DRAFT_644055 [Rickenella mellea]